MRVEFTKKKIVMWIASFHTTKLTLHVSWPKSCLLFCVLHLFKRRNPKQGQHIHHIFSNSFQNTLFFANILQKNPILVFNLNFLGDSWLLTKYLTQKISTYNVSSQRFLILRSLKLLSNKTIVISWHADKYFGFEFLINLDIIG